MPTATAGAVPSGERLRLTTAQWFFIFVMLIFIGQSPFSARTQEELVELTLNNSGTDILKQALFIGTSAGLFVLYLLQKHKMKPPLTALPILLIILWFLASCSWSVDPFVSFKRVIQQILIIFILYSATSIMGSRAVYRTLLLALIVSLIICFVSLGLTPNAYHPSTETDTALIGAWRGFFFHKNIAGAVFSMAMILFVLEYFDRRQWWYLLLAAMAAVFVVGSKSKTSLALGIVVLAIIPFYRAATKGPKRRVAGTLALAAIPILMLWGYIVFEAQIGRIFSDPEALTGRVSIWGVVLSYVRDNHWLTGSGFAGFWQMGDNSPAYAYATQPFHLQTAHSHDGYLEILATTGIPGLLLLLIGMVYIPAISLMYDPRHGTLQSAKAFAIWFFICLHNLMETSFFDKDRQIWLMFLIALVMILIPSEAREGNAPRVVSRGWRRNRALAST